jgi:hypothetical protein
MKDDDILKLARERYSLEKDLNSELRERQLDDIRFKAGDQWPEKIKTQRENDPYGARPCLVINHARTHTNRIINDIRQNRPQIKVLPVDDYADPDTADILNGLIRHIQVSGDADLAYDCATDFMVTMGEGYFEIITVEEDDGTQEIDIEPIINPHSVHMDPYHENPTGADAEWVFIDDPMKRDEAAKRWPDAELKDWEAAKSDLTLRDWYIDDVRVNVARYYVKSEGKVLFYRLLGDSIVEKGEFPGKHLPIIRVAGEETVISGKKDVRGLVRDIKDPCRMYNYWASTNTERIALAPKAPYVGASGTFDGFEAEWDAANTANIPRLEYNAYDDSGNPLPPPSRTPPISQDTAIIQAMLQAHDDIKAVSGIFDASLGNRSNETSGIAQRERKAESNTTTFHFVDNLSRAIRQAGRVIVDLIPIIYTEDRIVRVLGEDESPDFAETVTGTEQSHTETRDAAGKISHVYDLGVGKYDVTVRAGPSFSTRRQEAAIEMSALLQGNPQVMPIMGDLMLKNMDWPGADAMAERLEAMLPPEVKAIADAKKQGGDMVAMQVEQATQGILDQVEPVIMDLRQQLEQAMQAAQQAGMEGQQMKLAMAGKDLENQQLQNALKDKAGELELKAADIASKAKTEQMKVESEIIQAAMDAQAGKGEDDLANTVAAQAATQAVKQMTELAKSLAEQTQQIALTAAGAVSALESVTKAQERQSGEVIELKEYIAATEAKKAKVETAVLAYMKSDGSDKALTKTVKAIEKA